MLMKAVNYKKKNTNEATKFTSGFNYLKSRVLSEESKESMEYAVPKLLTKACANY